MIYSGFVLMTMICGMYIILGNLKKLISNSFL